MAESWNWIMNQDNNQNFEITIQKGLAALLLILREYLEKQIELKRIVRVAVLLIRAGVSINNSVFQEIARHCLREQKDDGGWIGVEDSMWCVVFLKNFEGYFKEYKSGLDWLDEQWLKNGGWGKTNRDIGRITTTGILLHLLPELSSEAGLRWLKNEWEKDLSCDIRLTYKGAFFLLGLKSSGISSHNCPLIKETYSFLENEQNDDCGFGPWKDHPIGSDPWSTGIVLLGLLAYAELTTRNVIEKAVNWLTEKQLSDGLWPYHYIDEGSSYVYWGLIEALKYLKSQ